MLKALEAFSLGDKKQLEAAGLTNETIDDIHQIMNIYSSPASPELHEIICAALQTHAPHTALLRMERFFQAGGPDVTVDLCTTECIMMLAAILSASGALSGRLNADPSFLRDLTALDQPNLQHVEKEYYLDTFRGALDTSGLLSDKVITLHHAHTVQLMRICARNADPRIPITEIYMELSSLAEAVIELCLELAAEELFTRIGIPARPHTLVVLGLGKLGGRELNVSSDVDLIYLCSDHESAWGQYDSITFHTMLAERMTRHLTEATARGMFYRVDIRLRADGASGPLVRTGRDYIRYLELRGEAWERQMLLKARPVAGDYSVANDFLGAVERFVFPSAITRSPNREIVALKNQIEARLISEGSKKSHLKLMPGGIRDIEFIAQCLQLLMGGIHPGVRSTGTLHALESLRDHNALSEQEFDTLSDAYIFYRRIENLLQWKDMLPVFSIPDTTEDIRGITKYLDINCGNNNPGDALSLEIDTKQKAVRALYNEIFSAEGGGSLEEMAIYTAIAPPGDEKAQRFLEKLGFAHPDESARHIADLAFEHIPGAAETAVHSSTERFLPKLLQKLSPLPDPGGALERFKHIAESYAARQTFFDILGSNETFFELIISLAHGSVFIADLLAADPSLLDWLFETAEILHPLNAGALKKELNRTDSACKNNLSFTQSCLILKNREKLRIGARDITGLSTTSGVFSELTAVAESIVKTVYARSYRELSSSHPALGKNYEFCIIAAGRLGAEIMNFGSDLDLIFVYTTESQGSHAIEIPQLSVKLARHILSLLTGGGGPNKIYDVDARLRPEGGNAVLAVSLEEYRRYLKRRASVWERLALVRARPVAGKKRFGETIMEDIHNFVYQQSFSCEGIQRIIDIRKAMIENSQERYPGLVNIKSGPGGIADIDFIAQAYAAHHGTDNPEIRKRETTAILEALASEGIIERAKTSALTELYTFLMDIEKVLRVSSGKAVNTLPESGIELSRIARMLGYKNIRRFIKRLDDVRTLTKEYYEQMMTELLDSAENGEA